MTNLTDIIEAIRPLVRQWIREELVALLTQPEETKLLKPKDAIAVLGYDSVEQLYADITAGLFRPGVEVVDMRRPGASKARWRVNISACLRRLAEDPEQRRAA